MRILLFITSVYNTFEEVTSSEFKKIIDKLDEIAEIEGDQRIMISFCDETENKNIFLYYLRDILEYIKEKKVSLGYQFLGNVYYKNIKDGGALLYNDKFCKEIEVFNYVDSLEKQDNYINLYYVDGNIDYDFLNEVFKNFGNDVSCNIIEERENGKGIVQSLEKIYNEKSLRYKMDGNIE